MHQGVIGGFTCGFQSLVEKLSGQDQTGFRFFFDK